MDRFTPGEAPVLHALPLSGPSPAEVAKIRVRVQHALCIFFTGTVYSMHNAGGNSSCKVSGGSAATRDHVESWPASIAARDAIWLSCTEWRAVSRGRHVIPL